MIKKILKKIDLPEPLPTVWRWQLAVRLVVVYIVAQFMALLLVTTQLDEDLGDPSAGALALSGLISTLIMVWLIYQYAANIAAEATPAGKKSRYRLPAVLAFGESHTVPAWIVWFWALAMAILLDAVALIAGKPANSLPLGLDRIEDANILIWVTVTFLVIVLRPVAEALLFQGILYPSLAAAYEDNRQGLFVTAAVFTGVYFIQSAGSEFGWGVWYWGLVYPLVLGMTLTVIRAHTKSTLTAAGASGMFGIFLMLKTLFVIL